MANLKATSVSGTLSISGTTTLTNISGTGQTVPNSYGAYLHLGSWADGRTAAGAVLVNTAYRADYATDLFDMNISRFTNNSGYITAYGAQGASGNFYIDDNYGASVIGLYDSYRYQGVYSMGDSYKLAIDGTTPGNLYGLAWTHTNVGGQSKAGLGHQLLVMMNGTTYTALGSGIWTDGTITTTSHGTSANWKQAYDWGNHASAGYLTSVTNISGAAGSAGYLTGGDSAFYGLLYNALSGDLNTYNSPGIYSAEYTGSTNRPEAAGGHFIQISDAGGTDVKTQWYYRSDGATIWMRLMWGNGAWKPWRSLITDANIGNQSVAYATSAGTANTANSATTASTATTATSASTVGWGGVSGKPNSISGYGITDGVTTAYNSSLNSDSRNSRGVTRLYRRDDDSDYSVQAYWTGSHWFLRGYGGDSFHAEARVGYADAAGSANTASSASTASQVTVNYNNDSNSTYQMLWGSGNSVYGTGGIYCNPNSDIIYAAAFYDANNTGYYLDPNSYSNLYTARAYEWQLHAGAGYGVRFWGGSSSYSIQMSEAGNGTWGGRVAGETTSDYNMYFTMTGGTNRGFVFRNSLSSGGVVAGIDAGGNFRAIGDAIVYASSDARLKKNVKPIENALDKVMQINGVEFDWDEAAQDVHKGHDVGVIAQEIEAVLPEIVQTRDNGYKAVKYEKLVALLIESVKELQAEIEDLKAQIK